MNSRHRSVALAAVAATGIAALVVAGLFGHIDRPASPPVVKPQVLAHTWTDGTLQSYRLDIDSDVRLTVTEFKFNRRLVQQVGGTLHMRVLDTASPYVQVGFQFEPEAYRLDGERRAVMEEHLSAPFLVSFDRNGRPLNFEFEAGTARDARILLEEALRLFQVVLPQPSEPVWTTEEDHATGRYVARYRAAPDGRVQKSKDVYTAVHVRLPSNRAADPQVNLQQSDGRFLLSADTSWLREATMSERLTVVQDGIQISESAVRAGLTLLPGAATGHGIALFAGTAWTDILEQYAVSRGDPDRDQPVAQQVDAVEKMHAYIERLNSGDEGHIALVRGLAELIAAYPGMADKLLARIGQAGISGKTDALLVHALELGGTPEAQGALSRLLNDRSQMQINRNRAAVALGAIENPTDRALQALSDMSLERGSGSSKFLSNSSVLAMGSIGRTLRDTDPVRAQAISRELMLRLNQAPDYHEATVMLKAIGNTRDASLINPVSGYLADESHRVRAAAAETLGRLGAEEMATSMTTQLRTETSGTVRSAIVETLDSFSVLPPDVLSLVDGMIVDEPSADARYQMARLLVHNLDNYPAAEATLARLSVSDRSNRVRKLALGTLTHRRRHAGGGQGG